jgi:hypothetical protein
LVRVPWHEIGGAKWRLFDVLSGERFDRDGEQMQFPGLFVDLAGWKSHFLKFIRAGQ